jgi:tetratricopeptide (TPR) repeat protein
MKKSKKIKGRKRQKSGRSQTPVSSGPKRTVRLIVPGLILCVAIGAFCYMWILNKAGKVPKEKTKLPVSSKEQPLPEHAASTITPEEEFSLLKQEEMELAQQILKDFPDSEDSYVLMGDLHARHGESAEAVKFWEKSLEINPKCFDAWRNMGSIALEKGQFDQALKFLRKALEIRPHAALRSDIAKALMDTGKYVEAITELQQEIKISPSSFTAHFQLAEAYLQQKEYDKAKKHYEETIKLQPNHSHAYHGLVTVCARLKQRDKAQEYRATFKKLRSKQSFAYMGRRWDTIADLESLRKGVVRTYLDAERPYLNSGNTAKVEELLNRASGLDPNDTRCLERLGALYYTTNRAPKALGCFENIARIDPNNPISYLNIGQVATRLKMFEKAERAFRRTAALAPNNPAGYRELARFYLRTNTNLTQALGLAQKAITLEKNAETYFLLGWAADVNGDRSSALQAMEQAVKLQPGNEKYRQIYERIKNRN